MKPGANLSVIFAFKGGVGDELLRLGPLLGRSVGRHGVALWTFHPTLYDPSLICLYALDEIAVPKFPQVRDGTRICFYARSRTNGPYRCQSLEYWARGNDWTMIDEIFGQPLPTVPLWRGADELARGLNLSVADYSPAFLRHDEPNNYYLVNLFGGCDPIKGLTCIESVRALLTKLAVSLPDTAFLVPVRPNQRSRMCLHNLPPNIAVQSFEYEDGRLTEIATGARAIVSVEGGMVHLGCCAGIPTLVLTSPEWYASVAGVMPGDGYSIAWCDLRRPDVDRTLAKVLPWIVEQRKR